MTADDRRREDRLADERDRALFGLRRAEERAEQALDELAHDGEVFEAHETEAERLLSERGYLHRR